MAIIDWPEADRPREKLIQAGPAALTDTELLAIFLRTGCAGSSAVDIARTLLHRFGGLQALLSASKDEVCQVEGLGPAKFSQLQAVLELGRRYLGEGLKQGLLMDSATAAREYLQAQLGHRAQEVFAVMFLDSRHCLLAFEELFHGTIDGASVYPREVVKQALKHNAAAVILAHNHPSGVAEPSQADVRITQRLVDALELVDVRVLDHVVVGRGTTTSFAQKGLLR